MTQIINNDFNSNTYSNTGISVETKFMIKDIDTLISKPILLNVNSSLINILNELNTKIPTLFINYKYFEIIIAGQDFNESAASLIFDQSTLFSAINFNLNTSFYIKHNDNKPIKYNTCRYGNYIIPTIQTIRSNTFECNVCLDIKYKIYMIYPYECIHSICIGCYNNWCASTNFINNLRCPECRS
jgi:hypothetical protein